MHFPWLAWLDRKKLTMDNAASSLWAKLMTDKSENDFFAGVIEGFYGTPWSMYERMELLEWMKAWKMNTYLYAPKDVLRAGRYT